MGAPSRQNSWFVRSRAILASNGAAWCALFVYLVFLAYVVADRRFVWDDAYMFGRYANNWASGSGWTWNPGEAPLNGLTSPLWTAIIYLSWRISLMLGASWDAILAAPSFIAGLFFCLFLFLSIRHQLPRAWRPLAFAPLYWLLRKPLLLYVYHMISGMETVLTAVMVLLWTWYALDTFMPRSKNDGLSEQTNNFPEKVSTFRAISRSITPVLLALFCYLLRPETVIFIGGALFFRAMPFMVRRQNQDAFARLAFIQGFLLFVALCAWHSIHYANFYHLFPLPARLKGFYWNSPYVALYSTIPRTIIEQPWDYVYTAWHLHLLLIAAIITKRQIRRFGWLWLPLHLALCYTLNTFAVMGVSCRYQLPFLGAVFLLIAASWRELALPPRELGKNSNLAPFAASVTAVCHLVVIFFAGYLLVAAWFITEGRTLRSLPHKTRAEAHQIVLKAAEKFPAGSTIAATEVGLLGIAAKDAVIYDLVGLHDREFSKGFSAEKLFARRVDALTLIHPHYVPIINAITNHPEWDNFEHLVGNLSDDTPYTNYDISIWINRTSPHYAEMKNAGKKQ